MVVSNVIDFSSKIEGKLVEENAARICAIKLEGMRAVHGRFTGGLL